MVADEPPFHHPAFVVTHHPRESLTMARWHNLPFRWSEWNPRGAQLGHNGLLDLAFEAARGQDVRLGGGAATIHQFLRAGLIDEMRLAFVPLLLGHGERLFDNLGDEAIGYECVDMVCSASATHVRFVRKSTSSAAAPSVGGTTA